MEIVLRGEERRSNRRWRGTLPLLLKASQLEIKAILTLTGCLRRIRSVEDLQGCKPSVKQKGMTGVTLKTFNSDVIGCFKKLDLELLSSHIPNYRYTCMYVNIIHFCIYLDRSGKYVGAVLA